MRKLFKAKKSATAIEYGLIAALIAVAAIAAMQDIAGNNSAAMSAHGNNSSSH